MPEGARIDQIVQAHRAGHRDQREGRHGRARRSRTRARPAEGGRGQPRGLPVPGHVHRRAGHVGHRPAASRWSPRRSTSTRPSTSTPARSSSAHRRRGPHGRQHPGVRGQEGRGLPQGRPRSLQPAQGQPGPAARLDRLLRQQAQGRRLHDAGGARRPVGVQHLQAPRPAARTDRLARREDHRGGAQPGRRHLAVLRPGEPRDRRDGVLRRPRRAQQGRREAARVLPRARTRRSADALRARAAPSWARRSPTPCRPSCTGPPTPSSGSTGRTTRSRSTEDGLEAFLDDLDRRLAWALADHAAQAGRARPGRPMQRGRDGRGLGEHDPARRRQRTRLRRQHRRARGQAALQRTAASTSPRSARIVGGGATAASIAYALAALGLTDLEIVVRDVSRAEMAAQVAQRAGVDVIVQSFEHPLLEKVDLLVSTVPGDAIGSRSHELAESSRCRLRRLLRPVAHPAGHGRGAGRPPGRHRSRPAGAPGRAPGGADDREHHRSRRASHSGTHALTP